jgi:hypothetical protein
MTEQEREAMLRQLVWHMLENDVEWNKIIAVRESMWHVIGRHIKREPMERGT